MCVIFLSDTFFSVAFPSFEEYGSTTRVCIKRKLCDYTEYTVEYEENLARETIIRLILKGMYLIQNNRNGMCVDCHQ